MSNTSTPGAELLKFAQDYKHNPNQHVVLDPYKEAVLLLRAKYATYETITETLNQNGVKVSEATVRNFCRRHQAAMKQMRAELDRKRKENGDGQMNLAGTGTEPGTKRQNSPEVGKPGPKIARDEL